MEFWEQVVNGMILAAMAGVTIVVHLWWLRRARELNENWAETCKQQNKQWVEHIKKVDDDWAERFNHMNTKWGELTTNVMESFNETSKKNQEATVAFYQTAQDNWRDGMVKALDTMEDRYLKYTMKITQARRLPGERS